MKKCVFLQHRNNVSYKTLSAKIRKKGHTTREDIYGAVAFYDGLIAK